MIDPAPWTDPDLQIESTDPRFAPDYWRRMGYYDLLEGRAQEKRSTVPPEYQSQYDEGWDQAKYELQEDPGAN